MRNAAEAQKQKKLADDNAAEAGREKVVAQQRQRDAEDAAEREKKARSAEAIARQDAEKNAKESRRQEGIANQQTLEAQNRSFDLRKQLGETAKVLSRDYGKGLEALRVAWQGVGEGKEPDTDIPLEAFDGLTAATFRINELRPLPGDWSQVVDLNDAHRFLTINEVSATTWKYLNVGELTRSDLPMPAILRSYGRLGRVEGVSTDGNRVAIEIGNLDKSIAILADLSRNNATLVLNYAIPDIDMQAFFTQGYSSVRFTPTLTALSPSGDYYAAVLPDDTQIYSRALRYPSNLSAKEVVTGTKRFGIWQTETGKKVEELATEGSYITALVFSPSGRLLAAGDESGAVTIWRVPETTPSIQIPGHGPPRSAWPSQNGIDVPQSVVQLAFSNSDDLVYSAAEDGRLRIWNLGAVQRI